MKRFSIVRQMIGPVLLLAMIGCSGTTDTAQTDQPSESTSPTSIDTVPGDGEGVTLVSLKVPNMH